MLHHALAAFEGFVRLMLASRTVSSLDALLAGPPSAHAFLAILEQLHRLPDAELPSQIAAVERALEPWPDPLRRAGDEILYEDFTLRPTAVLVRMLAFEPSHGGCLPSFVAALARAPELSRLTILDLFAEEIDDDGAIAIAESTVLAGLRDLRLGDRLSDQGFLAIARSPRLTQLEALHLAGTLSEDQTAFELADTPRMAKLVRLHVYADDDMSDDGFWALGMSPHLPTSIRAELLAELPPDELRARAAEFDFLADAYDSDEALITALTQCSSQSQQHEI